jgi:RND family efflux transporter MFP subunit
VSETVTATGTIETAGTLQLSFANGGTISRVRVAEGDTVKAGKALVSVDDASARQSLAQAKSSYVQAVTGAQTSSLSLSSAEQSVVAARATAKLNKTGYEQAVEQARTALADAMDSWSDACLDPADTCPSSDAWSQLRAAEAEVTSAKTAYQQAVQNATLDETTNNLKVSQAAATVTTATAKQSSDCSTYGASANQCVSANSSVVSAQQQYDSALNAQKVAAAQGQQNLVNADARITTANIALRKLQTTLPTQARDAISSAQDTLDSAVLAQTKGLAADEESIRKAEESLASMRASTVVVTTAVGSESTAQASIDVAQAGLSIARQTLRDTSLRAPVAGTVASIDATEGQAAPAGTTMVTLIPDASYQIIADFSEADATKVAVGQSAAVTFDALADGTATGTVTAVDILPTEGANVTTYGVTITLDEVPEGLKAGMSASVVVTTAQAADVLWAPTAAVTTAGGQSTVTVRVNGVDTVTPVKTGLAGDSGTEITSGVAQGDQLVVTSTGGTSFTGGFPIGGIPGGGIPGGGIPGGGAPPAGGGRR